MPLSMPHRANGRTRLFAASHRSEFLYREFGLSLLQPGRLIEVLPGALDFTFFQVHVAAMVVCRRISRIEADLLVEVLERALELQNSCKTKAADNERHRQIMAAAIAGLDNRVAAAD